MNCRRIATALLVAASALGVTGCERVKSANPLSPAIAGPIPGVEITAPKPLLPEQNKQIVATEQPLDLLIENAGTSGVRPLWLDVQVATDLSFQQVVLQTERLTPGDNGRTNYRIPALLPAETTYFWRVRAADGANTGPFSSVASFRILEPVILGAPTPLSPIGQITGIRPEFRIQNGSVSGPAGPLFYRIDIATTPAMVNGSTLSVAPGPGGITVASAGDMLPNTTYYWRVSQSDGQYSSPYSAVVEFRSGTPAPVLPSPINPGPVGSGGRTPNPGPGGKLPLPNMFHVVQQVALEYPNALGNSCQDHGGTWEFMDRLVDRLRTYDTRWGYNWKRGVVGDPSLDVVDYNWGNNADEGSTQVYIIDVIAGHCGSNPQASWIDVTDVTFGGGSIGRWTGRGRF